MPSWKQGHYYGMKSFLSRIYTNGGFISEQNYGLVKFKTAKALEDDPDAGLALEVLPELIDQLESKMKVAAKKLDFEEAANLRDRVKQLRQRMAG